MSLPTVPQCTLLFCHIHTYHLSILLHPLSIFLFLFHIKCIQITQVSTLLHTCTYHHVTSFHALLLTCILSSPSAAHLYPYFHLQKFLFVFSWTFFYSYILFLPLCIIKAIFPCLFCKLPYSNLYQLYQPKLTKYVLASRPPS